MSAIRRCADCEAAVAAATAAFVDAATEAASVVAPPDGLPPTPAEPSREMYRGEALLAFALALPPTDPAGTPTGVAGLAAPFIPEAGVRIITRTRGRPAESDTPPPAGGGPLLVEGRAGVPLMLLLLLPPLLEEPAATSPSPPPPAAAASRSCCCCCAFRALRAAA
jgi:hypothetical protein